MRLEGKIAVITGGGTGIGKQTGLLFAQEGADLVVLGPRADELELVRKEVEALSRRCLVHKVDVANEREVDDTIKASLKGFSRIDLLINNAAVFRSTTAPVVELSLQAWNEEIAVNLTGTFLCTKHVARLMVEQGRRGSIIVIVSTFAGSGSTPTITPAQPPSRR